MFASSFNEANTILDTPEGMTCDQVEALSVAVIDVSQNQSVIVSCWKVTKEELEEINRTGRVWLCVLGGVMPPVILTGKKADLI